MSSVHTVCLPVFLSSSLKAATFESHTIKKKLALYNRDEGG